MPPPQPEQRQRRAHTRSRNGCKACKRKHVRCDERKPLCTSCLVRGLPCEYPPVVPSIPQSGDLLPGEGNMTLVERLPYVVAPIKNSLPRHAFVTYPVSMSKESRYLFDIFAKSGGPSGQAPSPFVIKRALSDPAYLHGALLISSVRWSWNTGDMERIQDPFLHHKVNAIQFLNTQLQESNTTYEERTIVAIVALALAEGGLGSLETTTAHLAGLAKLIRTRDARKHERGGNVLQSVIYLLSSNAMPINELGRLIGAIDVGESLCLSAFTLMLERAWQVMREQDNPDLGACVVGEVLAANQDKNTTSKSTNPPANYTPPPPPPPLSIPSATTKEPSRLESRARWITCFFCIVATLGAYDTSPFMLSWLVGAILDDLEQTQERMCNGTFPVEFWYWGTMLANAAANVAQVSNTDSEYASEERKQIQVWRECAAEKIRFINRLLGIKDWDGVKRVIRSWRWDENPFEENMVRQMWEKAAFPQRQSNIVVQQNPLQELKAQEISNVQQRGEQKGVALPRRRQLVMVPDQAELDSPADLTVYLMSMHSQDDSPTIATVSWGRPDPPAGPPYFPPSPFLMGPHGGPSGKYWRKSIKEDKGETSSAGSSPGSSGGRGK